MTPAGLAALLTERDNLRAALEAAEAAREDAIQDANEWARMFDEEKTKLEEAKVYQYELKAHIVALQDQAATDAHTIARLRRQVADLARA